MKKISIVDYGCGNLLSISRALKKIGYKSEITNKKDLILESDFLILPGVGAFGNAMKLLRQNDLINVLNEYVLDKNKRLLGICLGMQILLSKSYEMGDYNGLDFIKGEVVQIKDKTKNKKLKIPHISWGKIFLNNKSDYEGKLNFDYLDLEYYFVHSFLALAKEKSSILAYCNYEDVLIPAIVMKDNVLGCQFHPEKSGNNGLNFLKNVINKW
jgi:imidazole glycerol-phosphate synthase subunit HisH